MDLMSLRFISNQSLFAAVRSADLESLKQIIHNLTEEEPSDQASISVLMAVKNDADETALYIAAENNLHEIFSYLLQFCDLQTVKIRSKSGMDAFHVAAKRGHLGMDFNSPTLSDFCYCVWFVASIDCMRVGFVLKVQEFRWYF